MKRLVVAIVIVFACSPLSGVAQTVGVVQGNIWYSKDPFFVGDSIRIYTGVFNGAAYDITGTVEFFDADLRIGSSTFAVPANGGLREVSIPWTAAFGSHSISATISSIAPKVGSQTVVVTNKQTVSDKRAVAVNTETKQPIMVASSSVIKEESNGEVSVIAIKAEAAAASIHESVKEFSVQQVVALEAKQRELERDLATLDEEDAQKVKLSDPDKINEAANQDVAMSVERGPSVNTTVQRIFKNVYLLVVKALIYILSHPWLLYTTLGLIILRFLLTIWRFFRNRKAY